MAILVDTNVISDVAHGQDEWATWSIEMMTNYTGEMRINPIIYAELCCRAESVAELDAILLGLGIQYLELSKDSLYQVSQAFLNYRKRGGTKASPLPDFFIGAHAATLGLPILTRDVARYRTYFPMVELICP